MTNYGSHRYNIQICKELNLHISILKFCRAPKKAVPLKVEGVSLLPLEPCLVNLHKPSLQTITEIIYRNRVRTSGKWKASRSRKFWNPEWYPYRDDEIKVSNKFSSLFISNMKEKSITVWTDYLSITCGWMCKQLRQSYCVPAWEYCRVRAVLCRGCYK